MIAYEHNIKNVWTWPILNIYLLICFKQKYENIFAFLSLFSLDI